MKKFLFFITISAIFSFSSFTYTLLTDWNISDDYSIKFETTKAAGIFTGLTGTVIFSPDDLPNARFDVSVPMNTIDTGNSRKNKHATGESWLNAEKYPSITFESSNFNQIASGYEVVGDLTLHGVTKTIAIPFAFNSNGSTGVFEGKFNVNRDDYKIEGSFGAFLVGDDIEVTLRVPVRQ